MHISHDIIHDPRVTPGNLRSIIDVVTDELEKAAAAFKNIDEQMTLHHALKRLGMRGVSNHFEYLLEQHAAAEKAFEQKRRTLEGLKAIEAARAANPPPERVREPRRVFDKHGRLVPESEGNHAA